MLVNCGGPAVAVLLRCWFPVVVQRPIPMVFLLGKPWRLRSCSIFLVVDAAVVDSQYLWHLCDAKPVLCPRCRFFLLDYGWLEEQVPGDVRRCQGVFRVITGVTGIRQA